jgi:hypothetical protein
VRVKKNILKKNCRLKKSNYLCSPLKMIEGFKIKEEQDGES